MIAFSSCDAIRRLFTASIAGVSVNWGVGYAFIQAYSRLIGRW